MDIIPVQRITTLEDINALQEVIALHNEHVSSIDEDIESLMKQLHNLHLQRAEYSQRIKQCQGMITLARRLPLEILTMIVEMCVWDGNGSAKAPLHASQVCSEWRALIEVPTVWSVLDLEVNDSSHHLEQAALWLSRADNVPLHVVLRMSIIPPNFHELATLLRSHAHRYHTLTIGAEVFSDVVYALSHLRSSYPALRRISFSSWFERFIDDTESENAINGLDFQQMLGDLPLLRELQIGRGRMVFSNAPQSITRLHIQLRHTDLSSFLSPSANASILRLLADVPFLEILNIEMAPERFQIVLEEADANSSIIELPALQSLLLVGQHDLFKILSHIHTPKLTSIHLRSVPMFREESSDQRDANTPVDEWLCSFLVRSTPIVEEVQLHDVDLQINNFRRFFEALPYLKDIRMHDSDINDDILRLLQAPDGFCPQLEKIDLRWCGSVSGSALVALVQSRLEPTSIMQSIREVAAINCSMVKDDDVATLAGQTLCRVVATPGDHFCRSRGCCKNDKYTLRLRINLGSKHIILPHPRSGRGLIL